MIASVRSVFLKAIVHGCIDSSKDASSGSCHFELNEERLKERTPVLAKLIQESGDAERTELLCLFELQDLADELSHPNSEF